VKDTDVGLEHSTSVESLRTLPAIKKMHEYYGTQGLRVVGVHRPRYHFARSLPIVADAVQRLKIDYPVVNDVDADLAHAYGAQKLDTIFLVNHDNKIVGRKSGREASVAMLSEVCHSLSSINPLLRCLPITPPSFLLHGTEAQKKSAFTHDSVQQGLYVHYDNPKFGARCRAATADIFVGEARASALDVGNSAGRGSLSAQQSYGVPKQRASYTDMSGLTLNDGTFVLSGDWITHKEGMVATADPVSGFANTHLRLRYHGKAVYVLMGLVFECTPSLPPNILLPPSPHSICFTAPPSCSDYSVVCIVYACSCTHIESTVSGLLVLMYMCLIGGSRSWGG